ncbi:hypothetical protein ACIRSS_23515 [Amycolatopsis sp. NPDC101161]|uniref:hypothetical protein n=1 Tax=Amycolatopsis sp. NPDC101161 TaxID=3363940 RepID=UPI003806DD70
MKTGAIACVSAFRGTEAPRRRGRSVGRGLSSTDDFTNARLSPANRQLVLFLVVVLTRDDGCLTRMYERLITRHAGERGHWLYGKSVEQMQSGCSKYLGKSAKYRPRWDMIIDALRAQVPADELPAILAHVAGLYCRAAGLDRPDGEYEGEIIEPVWTEDSVVTTTMIQDLLASPSETDATTAADEQTGAIHGQLDPTTLALLDELAQIRAKLADTEARLAEMTAERDRYREMQTYLNRGVRVLDLEVQRLTDELARRRRDVQLGELVAENTQLRDRVRDLSGQLAHLARRHARVLKDDFFPDVSRKTLLALAHEQAEAGRPRRHGLNNLEVLPLAAGNNLDEAWETEFGTPFGYGFPEPSTEPRPLRKPAHVPSA